MTILKPQKWEEELLLKQCIKQFNNPITLHSGDTSTWMFDAGKILENPVLSANINRWLTSILNDDIFLFGVEFFGAVLLSSLSRPFGIIRKDGSVYRSPFEDRLPIWAEYLSIGIFDDVVTTGNSILSAETIISKKYNKKVDSYWCILNRGNINGINSYISQETLHEFLERNKLPLAIKGG